MATVSGYSSTVALSLDIQGESIPLAQVAPNRFIVQDACERRDPCEAMLNIVVDGEVDTTAIRLPDGIPGPGVWVAYEATSS